MARATEGRDSDEGQEGSEGGRSDLVERGPSASMSIRDNRRPSRDASHTGRSSLPADAYLLKATPKVLPLSI
ncbi:hypothetical protein E2C01_017751 [Portunus trituberculatus]|uniref:Uncharacterized protein n=1 Tax=Portunus trituberculatus TaxID=210409 RepID=A0A5B7DUN5_PORTR|nr:hypothetical protein [Portunus trituberculatus]